MPTISEYLEADHNRLDSMIPVVLDRLGRGDYAGSAVQFAEFSSGLNRHIDAEEQILFPAFEEITGMRSGPTVVMRAEHVEIRDWMTRVAAAIEARDESGAREGVTRLVAVLGGHNMKEESILYPMTDRAASDSQRADIVERMQAL